MCDLYNKENYQIPELDFEVIENWHMSSFRISNVKESSPPKYIFNKINVTKDMFTECFNLIKNYHNELLKTESTLLTEYASQNLKATYAIIEDPFTNYDNIKCFHDSVISKIDENAPKTLRTCHGYVLYIKTQDDKEITMIKKTNPYISVAKNKLLYSLSNINDKLTNCLQIHAASDAIFIDGKCILMTDLAEGIFVFERYYKNQCNNCLNAIDDKNIISGDYDFKAFSLKGQTPRFFSTYDPEVINKIKNKDSDILDLIWELELDMINDKVLIEDEISARKFISLVCRRAFKELISNDIVDVSHYTHLIHKS